MWLFILYYYANTKGCVAEISSLWSGCFLSLCFLSLQQKANQVLLFSTLKAEFLMRSRNETKGDTTGKTLLIVAAHPPQWSWTQLLLLLFQGVTEMWDDSVATRVPCQWKVKKCLDLQRDLSSCRFWPPELKIPLCLAETSGFLSV